MTKRRVHDNPLFCFWGAVAHVTAPLLFVESKNKKHVFVKIKACATDFLENQDFQGICDAHAFLYYSIIRLILRDVAALSVKMMCSSHLLQHFLRSHIGEQLTAVQAERGPIQSFVLHPAKLYPALFAKLHPALYQR